ncbi:MAG TPA: hypothetical protein VMU50_17165 [Polyangia bacterium]|nr:hypothetical protein [Polyangia bacterium]
MLRSVIAASGLGLALWVATLTGFSWPPPAPLPPPPSRVAVRIAGDSPVAIVDARFLSFAVDTAQVVGGEFWAPRESARGILSTHAVARYDFARPRLRGLAAGLAPAYLRIGGTDADRTVYRMDAADGARVAPPDGARWVLTRSRWDEVNAFARDVGVRLMFTLNAGPSARDGDGAWDPANARALVRYTRDHDFPVDVWELGNEINAFPLTHRRWLSAERYAADLRTARALVDEQPGTARLAGVGSAFWPLLGEGRAITDRALRAAPGALDIVTWHYYPQQSHRCPLATRRADRARTAAPDRLSDVDRWAAEVEAAARAHAPRAEVWLGETASAQCGGEPGVSNTFADALWWLDELGRMARRGQQVVVRQTLSGSDYGLIDDETLQPNPSYWASWLWRRLMGTRVLDVAVAPSAPAVRAYAHCLADGAGAGEIALLLLNVDPAAAVTVDVGPGSRRVFRLRADDLGLGARRVRVNGRALEAAADGTPPLLATLVTDDDRLSLAPLSATFVVLPSAGAAACGQSR